MKHKMEIIYGPSTTQDGYGRAYKVFDDETKEVSYEPILLTAEEEVEATLFYEYAQACKKEQQKKWYQFWKEGFQQ